MKPFSLYSLKRAACSLALALTALSLGACGGATGVTAPEAAATLPSVSAAAAVSAIPAGSQQQDNVAVDRYVQEQMAASHIPGLSLAVMQDGNLVYAKAYGYANLQTALPARPEQRFEIGSMTKSFVATAVMMLVEEGKVDLDQPVATYLGPVPATWAGMTVRHLLNHTSGLPEYPDEATFSALDANVHYSDDQLLDIAKHFALVGPPGGNWSYSNVAYDLLGILIGKVTGKFYGDFLQERIFDPLDMRSARIMSPLLSAEGSATGYVGKDGAPTPYQTSAGHRYYLGLAASGIEVSALDMAKWDAALRTERLLKRSSLDAMWRVSALVQAQVGSNKIDVNYGLGWFLSTINGHRKVYHSGSMPAFTSDFIRYPDDGLSVVILTNIDFNTADPQPMTRAIARMFNPALP